MNGILVIDKPEDFTSFDVIAKIRGMLKLRRIGHAGTLDPMATGVLPLLVGPATRAMDILPIQDKEYVAGFRFGVTTDTLDITGKILSESPFSVTREQLDTACEGFRGDITQIPPMYSAVQKDGVRLYDLARQGIEVERERRACTIHELEIIRYDDEKGEGTMHIKCSKGTYIRTLVADIGDKLGCGAVLTELRRTMAAGFTCENAITLEEAQKHCDDGDLPSLILPVSSAFEVYPKVKITQNQAVRFSNGGGLRMDYLTFDPDSSDIFTVWRNDEFLGLGRPDFEKEELRVFKLFLAQ